MNYPDRRAAERVARGLLLLGRPKPIFRSLHHRTTLRDTEGVAEHMNWVQSNEAPLTGSQKVLAERLHGLPVVAEEARTSTCSPNAPTAPRTKGCA